MGTTVNRSYPFPEGTSAVKPTVYVKALADVIDTDVQGVKVSVDGKAPLIHQHSMGQVDGLDTALGARPLRSSSHVWHRTLDEGESVDTLQTRGYFGWTKPNVPTHPGLPPGVTEQGVVEILVGQSAWTAMQRATESLTGREWVRMMRNPSTNQWWPWREKAFLDNASTGGGETARLSPDWIHFGDSHTDDVVLGANQWTRVLAGLTGQAHDTRGWYNQRSFEIAARAGATLYPVTVAGGSIPASGSVGVVGQREQQLAFGSYAGLMSRTIPGWLAGRHGTLRNPDNGAGMTFTPDDNAAAPTSVTGTAWFEGDATAGAGRILTIWIGANDRSREKPAALVELVRAMLDRVPHARAYVFGIFPGSGGAFATESRAISNAFRAEWPDLYFDPLHALTQDQAATDAGITFTAQDQADIAAGIVPGSFRSDGVHLNANGATALAYAVFRDAIARGWTIPSGGVTGAKQTLPAPSNDADYWSGWRDVTSLRHPDLSGGSLFLARTGRLCMLMVNGATTATVGHRNLITLPAGFGVQAVTGANWRNGELASDDGSAVRPTSFFNARMRVLNMPSGPSMGGTVSWITADPPPVTLPGTSAST